MRRRNLEGVYDTHTNMMLYPKIMQPTHAKWEHVPPPSANIQHKSLTNGVTNGHTTNGSIESPSHSNPLDTAPPTIFSDVPPIISRNFAVIDTHFTAPPISNAGYPGPDGSVLDPTSGPNGLGSIPLALLDELPDDCRRAFDEAKAVEAGWKKQWGTDKQSALRGDLRIGFLGCPV